MLLSNRWRGRRDHLWRRRVFLDPLLAGQLSGGLDHIAMPLLSLDLGGGFSVDSVCHLRDRPALAFHRTFYELQPSAKRFYPIGAIIAPEGAQESDHLHRPLLRARRERPRRHAAEQRDE